MMRLAMLTLFLYATALPAAEPAVLERLQYNHPGLVVDLGVGLWAWPLPMDFDGDGDFDLVVNCPDQPYNGVYFFENPGPRGVKYPVFKPAKRISKGLQNVQVSFVDGQPRVLTPGNEYPDFLKSGLEKPVKLLPPANVHPNRVRENVWRYVDFDSDGKLDIIVGVDDWTEYGWDDGYNEQGHWKRGPLHGYVYLLRNEGTSDKPSYAKAEKLLAGGKPVDTFGWPTPNLADFDDDGDRDLICGEFLDQFTYFENVGTRQQPEFAAGKRLMNAGRPLAMDLQMIVPVAVDWDGDGDQDLIVGDEDGRVALVEHSGRIIDRVPQFLPPRYFQQEAEDVKCGALATPVGVDWDGDGDHDIVCGNTAGYIEWFENLSGPQVERPKWAAPRKLQAAGETIRIQAGPNGSIQGPCEAKWGYTTLSACDWDHDGLTDLIVNSIWGRVQWYRNLGPKADPHLAAAEPIQVEWEGPTPKPAWVWWQPQGKELVTQWRTTPIGIDLTKDGLFDLIMLDPEGYPVLFRRERRGEQLVLLPGQRAFFDEEGKLLRLNAGERGKSGRRKWTMADWDGDGKLDILLNSQNANLLRQVEEQEGKFRFREEGPVALRKIEGHDTSPTVVDFNGDNVPDLLIGAEDGRLYYLRNRR